MVDVSVLANNSDNFIIVMNFNSLKKTVTSTRGGARRNAIASPFRPSWGSYIRKPTSIVQSLFLSQIEPGRASKRYFDLDTLIARQVQKSRAQHVPASTSDNENALDQEKRSGRGRKRKGKDKSVADVTVTHVRGLTIITCNDPRSQHLLLTSNTGGSGFLSVEDEKIYWRLSKHNQPTSASAVNGRGASRGGGRGRGSRRGHGARRQSQDEDQDSNEEAEQQSRQRQRQRRESDDDLSLFCSVAFADVEPAMDRTIRKLFQIDTQRSGKFGIDRDVFYPSISPPGPEDQGFGHNDSDSHYQTLPGSLSPSMSILKKWRPTMFVLPKKENSLQLYNLADGELEQDEYLTFDGTTQFGKISWQENGNIYVECVQNSLPKDMLTEFLVFKYPHLRLESRVRISKPADKKSLSISFDFCDDFVLVCWPNNKVEFYDLQQLFKSAQVIQVDSDRDQYGFSTTTYHIEKLPNPLFTVKTFEKYLVLNPYLEPPYFICRTKNSYEIRELDVNDDPTKEQSILVEDGYMNVPFNFQDSIDSVQITFLSFGSGPPRIIIKERTRIRICEIVRWDELKVKKIKTEPIIEIDVNENGSNVKGRETKKGSVLRLLFDKDYQAEVQSNFEDSECHVAKRGGLRKIARKSYSFDESIIVAFDENEFLSQLAVIRFAESWTRCYVYDTNNNYQLQYTIEPSFFQPKAGEIHDELHCCFTTHFIALIRKGKSDSALYIFNLTKGLE